MSRDLKQTKEQTQQLEVRSLYKSHSDHAVLADISFSLQPGEIVAIIGSSGCGKSTLLRCLNFLDPPDSGEIRLHGKTFTPNIKNEEAALKQTYALRDAVGIVFQELNLFPHLTVENNITLALEKVQGLSTEEARKRALEMLDKVNMTRFKDRKPDSLSGGQQQRVAIARALAMEPQVLLYDEPMSALDPQGSKEIIGLMRELKKAGIIQIMVAHNMRVVQDCADRVILLEDGKIAENLSKEEIFAPGSSSKIYRFISTLEGLDS